MYNTHRFLKGHTQEYWHSDMSYFFPEDDDDDE